MSKTTNFPAPNRWTAQEKRDYLLVVCDAIGDRGDRLLFDSSLKEMEQTQKYLVEVGFKLPWSAKDPKEGGKKARTTKRSSPRLRRKYPRRSKRLSK